jgi:hypothetical protein
MSTPAMHINPPNNKRYKSTNYHPNCGNFPSPYNADVELQLA